MSNYTSRREREALEAEFDALPPEPTGSGDGPVSAVISVRLRHDELALIESAASEAGTPLSTFIRLAALGAANPIDVRQAGARAEAIADEARELAALLRSHVA